MDRIAVSELAQWCEAKLPDGADILAGPDVVFDSREVTPGALFVAIPGSRVDGHDFLESAKSLGAAAALVERKLATALPQLVVPNTVAALAKLAKHNLAKTRPQIIGVTGSVGKTSTKDLISQVLMPLGEVVAPAGSFNNEIGLPITACRVSSDTAVFVAEMGADRFGNIAHLCDIAPPNIGVITTVGLSHAQWFGSITGVATEKSVLVQRTKDWVVLNADDPLVWEMRRLAPAKVAAYSISKPYSADLSVWASDIKLDALGRPAFVLHSGTETAKVQLQLLGSHQVQNSLAAAATAIVSGLEVSQVATLLSQATVRSKWRMELIELPQDILVVNDSYNANPQSMLAALKAVTEIGHNRRIIAVLGDMKELGATSDAEHRRVGELASNLGISELIAVGDYAKFYAEGFASAKCVANREDAIRLTLDMIEPGDIVLLKASRSMGLEKLAKSIEDMIRG